MSTVKVKKVTSTIDAQETLTKPKKRNWLVVVLSVLLIALSSFSFYQYSQVDALKNQLLEAQSDLKKVQTDRDHYFDQAKQNERLYHTSQTNHNALYKKFTQFKNTYFIPVSEWNIYKDTVALTTSPHGNCAYHLPSCPHLGESFYLMTIKESERKGCWPCSDCHDKDFYYSGPKDEFDKIMFKMYFGN